MSNTSETITFGEWVRRGRVQKEVSLRTLAARLDITPSYLSDIENDRRVPAEDVLRRFADVLELDFDELMARAGRFGEDIERYMKSQPEAVRLFRRISEARMTPDKLRKLQEHIDKDTLQD